MLEHYTGASKDPQHEAIAAAHAAAEDDEAELELQYEV